LGVKERHYVQTVAETPGGEIGVVGLHLPYFRSGPRRDSYRLVYGKNADDLMRAAAALLDNEALPLVFAGDYNIYYGSEYKPDMAKSAITCSDKSNAEKYLSVSPVNILKQCYGVTFNSSKVPSYPGGGQIDYIGVIEREGFNFSKLSYIETPTGDKTTQYASDHFPIILEINY
jgi:endonuclease/exonuclease/phosphatase family metal-dependent hydrolase